jgi:two-component system sensor histidine kinase BaeS
MDYCQKLHVSETSNCDKNRSGGVVMKFGVTHKLFLAILTAAGLAVVISVLIMQWSLDRGFLKFVNTMEQTGISRLATKLEENYRTDQNWDFLQHDPELWRRLISTAMPESAQPPEMGIPPSPPPEGRMPVAPPPGERMPFAPPPQHFGGDKPGPRPGPGPPQIDRRFDERLFLLNADRKVLIGHAGVTADNSATPLTYQGKVVGYLGLLPRTNVSEAPQQLFLKEQKLAFSLVAGVVVLLSTALSLILARRLVRPLQEVTLATHQLAAGSFSVRVPVSSQDELGQLAGDFNSLALALEKGEQTRRQWVADISHELRTPITILRAEIEALQDGIRQPTPNTINSLHGEVVRLGRLVDDLYQLSLSDIGALTFRKIELNLVDLITETIAIYHSEFTAKQMRLDTSCSVSGGSALLFGDPGRLRQLFSNLLDNSLKYTDAGGSVRIDLESSADAITVNLKDSAPGVPFSELGKLFDRLYRVESSRNRASGGAGLGLAICRSIVEAHNGTISAQESPLGGVCIRIELPLAGRG